MVPARGTDVLGDRASVAINFREIPTDTGGQPAAILRMQIGKGESFQVIAAIADADLVARFKMRHAADVRGGEQRWLNSQAGEHVQIGETKR
jgi:hypothetical protein